MEHDRRFAALKEKDEQLQEERPISEKLELAWRVYTLSIQLLDDYGDEAWLHVSLAAFQLGKLLVKTAGDEDEIEQLLTQSLEGLEKPQAQQAQQEEPLRFLRIQAEINQLLSVLCARQSRAREALSYGMLTLQRYELMDELSPGEMASMHSRFWGLLAEISEEHATKKARAAHVKQQLGYYQSRLESSPITAPALLATIEHYASRLYEQNGQPRKMLHAKIAAVAWQKQYHAAAQSPVDHILIDYLASLASTYHEQGNDRRALPCIVELIELSQQHVITDEHALSLIAHSYTLRVRHSSRIGHTQQAHAYCLDAIEQLPILQSRAQEDETRASILHHLYRMMQLHHEYLCWHKAQPEVRLTAAIDGLSHMCEAYKLMHSVDYANELQRALLSCGDCYAECRHRREAMKCYKQVIAMHDALFDDTEEDEVMEVQHALLAQLFGEAVERSLLMADSPDHKSQKMSKMASKRLEELLD